MRRQAYDRDSVDQYVEAVRGQLPDAALSDSVSQAATVIPGSGDPVDKMSGALPSARQAEPSSGGGAGGAVPYLAREPTVSLVQSAVENALRERGVPDQPPGPEGLWEKIVRIVEGFLHRGNFGPEDPDWVVKIAESMLGHLAKGNHPFNPEAGRARDQRHGAARRGRRLGYRAAPGACCGQVYGRRGRRRAEERA